MSLFHGDKMLTFVIIALLGGGLLVLTSASVVQGAAEFEQPFYYISRQLLLGLTAGILCAVVASVLSEKWWHRLAFPIIGAVIFLMILVFIPGIGFGAGGAQRWIALGPITLQPSEFAKFAFVLYLALWLSKRRDDLDSLETGVVPFIGILVPAGLLLILQPDISTLGIILFTALAMFFAAGGKLIHVLGMIGLGLVAVTLLIAIAPYRLNRFTAFLNPEHDPLGNTYQINQATLAIGSGGIVGRGFGFSRQKFLYLPEPVGDSIFAVLAEEVGFIGSLVFISLFVVFAWRGFRISARAPSDFLSLFAFGLTFWIITQALLNMAGNLALAPLLGIPLPFVSYGSSSLAVTLASVGALIGISRINEEA